MNIGTLANGWNIIAVPTNPPSPMTIEWDLNDMIGEVASPYSGQSQQQDWQTDWLSGKLSLAPMRVEWAAPWTAFLAELRGRLNAFVVGDPLSPAPRGAAITGANGVTANGAQSARARVITTAGWAPNQQAQLLYGDWIQVGGAKNAQGQYTTAPRLHLVIGGNVDSDNNGHATIYIWPSLREAMNPGDAITLNQPCGLFRLGGNQRSWGVRRDKLFTIGFDIKEAL